ncbi:MAG: 30S ribosomal protein S8 [Candidatus Omnitrophica bacterium]|nr:30S ribosomal protein S8 [Candidatus Omnitrophota bacterium]
MSVTDPIADMLAILKTGIMAHKQTVIAKRSRLSESILEILKKEGFIANHKTIDDKRQGLIKVYLKYEKDNSPALTDLKRISKSGRKVYIKSKEIKSVYGGIGIALISTPEGVMTDREAKEKNLGGEILCHVW